MALIARCKHRKARARSDWSEATKGNERLVRQFEAIVNYLFLHRSRFNIFVYVASRIKEILGRASVVED